MRQPSHSRMTSFAGLFASHTNLCRAGTSPRALSIAVPGAPLAASAPPAVPPRARLSGTSFGSAAAPAGGLGEAVCGGACGADEVAVVLPPLSSGGLSARPRRPSSVALDRLSAKSPPKHHQPP